MTDREGLPGQQDWTSFIPVQTSKSPDMLMCYVAILCMQLPYSLAAEACS